MGNAQRNNNFVPATGNPFSDLKTALALQKAGNEVTVHDGKVELKKAPSRVVPLNAAGERALAEHSAREGAAIATAAINKAAAAQRKADIVAGKVMPEMFAQVEVEAKGFFASNGHWPNSKTILSSWLAGRKGQAWQQQQKEAAAAQAEADKQQAELVKAARGKQLQRDLAEGNLDQRLAEALDDERDSLLDKVVHDIVVAVRATGGKTYKVNIANGTPEAGRLIGRWLHGVRKQLGGYFAFELAEPQVTLVDCLIKVEQKLNNAFGKMEAEKRQVSDAEIGAIISRKESLPLAVAELLVAASEQGRSFIGFKNLNEGSVKARALLCAVDMVLVKADRSPEDIKAIKDLIFFGEAALAKLGKTVYLDDQQKAGTGNPTAKAEAKAKKAVRAERDREERNAMKGASNGSPSNQQKGKKK